MANQVEYGAARKPVTAVLRDLRALPYLEISARTDLPDEVLERVLNDMETEGLIRRTDKSDARVVVAREKLYKK